VFKPLKKQTKKLFEEVSLRHQISSIKDRNKFFYGDLIEDINV